MFISHTVILDSEPLRFVPGDWNVTWAIVVACLIVLSLLLLSNVLRRSIPFLRKSLLPVSFIGGAIGLILKIIFQYSELALTSETLLTNGFTSVLQTLTYHALAIGFIALGLKTIDAKRVKSKEMGRDSFRAGLIIIGAYLIQGIVGIIITVLFSLFPGSTVSPFAGLLLPMGFGQGPGQAMNIGSIFEEQGGFLGGTNFGLTISTMGFASAAIGGVIFLNYAAKKGLVKRREDDAILLDGEERVEKKGEVPLSDSIDKLTLQVALIALTYLITFGVIFGIDKLSALLGEDNFLSKPIVPLLYGFNFIFATIFAMVIKKIIASLKKKNVIKREYVNNFLLERIAGFVFDVMIISSIMAIDIRNFFADWTIIVSLIALGLVGMIITFIYVKFTTNRAFKKYPQEGFVIFYGNLTGTASDGIALLREIDPHFKTPAADTLVYGSTVAIGLGFPVLLLTGYIYTNHELGLASPSLWVSIAIMIAYFLVINLIFILITGGFKKRPKAGLKR